MGLIKNHPSFEVDVTDDTSEENLKTKIQNCDGVSVRIAKLSGEVMKEAKNLKIISSDSSENTIILIKHLFFDIKEACLYIALFL